MSTKKRESSNDGEKIIFKDKELKMPCQDGRNTVKKEIKKLFLQ
jgi:hypothetical protein